MLCRFCKQDVHPINLRRHINGAHREAYQQVQSMLQRYDDDHGLEDVTEQLHAEKVIAKYDEGRTSLYVARLLWPVDKKP